MNKKNAKIITPEGKFRKLILHFNIDKTIVMRDLLKYNNSDFMLRLILSELIWGKEEEKKPGEKVFTIASKAISYVKPQDTEEDVVSYAEYLNQNYRDVSLEEFENLEPKPELNFEDFNKARAKKKLQEICDLMETGHPGVKFKKPFEEMRKKLRVDEKIQIDLGLKLDNNKPDVDNLNEELSPKFNNLTDDYDNKYRFGRIFRNSYHKLVISFFNMIINLKKIKQDFAIVFRFFGHDDAEIEEILYEFNAFCNSIHPRFCGDYGYSKVVFDPKKDKKTFTIDSKTQEFMAVVYRGTGENEEKVFFETKEHPPFSEIEEHRENIDEFYTDSNENGEGISPTVGYNNFNEQNNSKLFFLCL